MCVYVCMYTCVCVYVCMHVVCVCAYMCLHVCVHAHLVAALCHTSLSGSGPQYLSDLTHVYTPSRSLRSSSDTRILSTPKFKLKSYGQRSFAYHCPTTWNSLPLALRYQQESDCFKRALKTHMFSLS